MIGRLKDERGSGDLLQRKLQNSARTLAAQLAEQGIRQEDVAEMAGITRGRWSQILNGPEESIPMHAAAVVHRDTGNDHLTQAYCKACGGVFVPLPATTLSVGAATSAFEEACRRLSVGIRESGEALAMTSEALLGRVATRETKAEIREEILEAISALVAIHQAIDDMPERTAAPLGGLGGGEKF